MPRSSRTSMAFLALFIVIGAAALAANGQGWQIKIDAPAANAAPFAPNGPIGVYKGRTSWPAGSDTIDMVAMYTLTGSSNPFKGVNVSSNYANYSKTQNQDGSGTGTFNSQNVMPPLLAPSTSSTQFWIVALPENAASGASVNSQGVPYYDSVFEKTSN